MRKKRFFVIVFSVIGSGIAAVIAVFLGIAFFLAQRADYGWSPGISTPALTYW